MYYARKYLCHMSIIIQRKEKQRKRNETFSKIHCLKNFNCYTYFSFKIVLNKFYTIQSMNNVLFFFLI